MKKALEYSFITCTVAFLLGAAVLLVPFATLFRGSQEPVVDVDGWLIALTLMLSELPWWGDYRYLVIVLPWLVSVAALTLLFRRFDGRGSRRVFHAGLSVAAYYVAVCLGCIIEGAVFGWGDIAYGLMWIWPLAAFGCGAAAAGLLERVLKPGLTDRRSDCERRANPSLDS